MTDQECTQEALLEREKRYRSIIEDQTELICRFRPDYTLTFVNTAYCRFFKKKKEELIGFNFMNLIPDGDRQKVGDQIASLTKELPVLTQEHQVFLPNGEIGFQQWTSRVILNRKGDIEEFQAVGRDITDRKRAEEALKKANDDLERLVENRTDRLLKRNRQLLKEIEERKKTEEALRASEEKYRSVVDHIGIGVSLISPDMEIVTLNNQLKKWFPDIDVSKKPVCYEAFNNPPRETTCSYCPTIKTLQDGQVHESITETPAGNEIRHYRIIASPIKDRNGNVLSAIEMVDDFTEKIKVQERLQESEAKYRNLIENINDVIFSVDTRRCITYISPAVERFLRYKVNEIIGVPFTRFVHPDDLPALLSRFEKTLSGNLQPYEFRVFAKDGAIFHVRTSSRPLLKDGRPVGLTGVMTDISEFKQAENALRLSEENFRRSLEDSPLGVRIVTIEGETIYANRAILYFYGCDSIEELRTTPVKKRYTPESFAEFQIRKEKRKRGNDGPSEYGISIVRKDGEVRHLQVFRKEILWNGEKQFQVIYQDITEHKQAEETLKKRERELEIKSRNLEELNTALKVLLKQRGDDKDELEEKVLANVKQLAMPYIEKLKKSRLKNKETDYVNILESNLINIISPFSNKLSSKYINLTPKEIQIANLIKEGKTSKEIAELLNISPGTVEFHRENIRRKLNLKNKKDNLRSYLMTLS